MGGFRAEKQLLLVPSRFAIAMQDDKWILRNDLIWHKPNALPLREADRLNLAHEHRCHSGRDHKSEWRIESWPIRVHRDSNNGFSWQLQVCSFQSARRSSIAQEGLFKS